MHILDIIAFLEKYKVVWIHFDNNLKQRWQLGSPCLLTRLNCIYQLFNTYDWSSFAGIYVDSGRDNEIERYPVLVINNCDEIRQYDNFKTYMMDIINTVLMIDGIPRVVADGLNNMTLDLRKF